jgi:hypothetical protein
MALQRILQNELYTGTRTFGKRASGRHAMVVDGAAGYVPHGADNKGRDVVRIAAYPRIIDDELFAAVQARLADARRRGYRKPGTISRNGAVAYAVAPLAGLCRCGLCGSVLWSCHQKPYHYMTCKRARDEGPLSCAARNMGADEILRRVLAVLSDSLLAGDTVARLVELAGEAEDEARAAWQASIDAGRRAVEACEQKLATARLRLADAPEDLLEDYQNVVRELKQQREAALDALAALRADPPVAEEGDAELLTRWLESCRCLCNNALESEPATQNAILRELIEVVRVWPAVKVIRGKQTVGRVEVVLPEWLSRVLAATAGPGC